MTPPCRAVERRGAARGQRPSRRASREPRTSQPAAAGVGGRLADRLRRRRRPAGGPRVGAAPAARAIREGDLGARQPRAAHPPRRAPAAAGRAALSPPGASSAGGSTWSPRRTPIRSGTGRAGRCGSPRCSSSTTTASAATSARRGRRRCAAPTTPAWSASTSSSCTPTRTRAARPGARPACARPRGGWRQRDPTLPTVLVNHFPLLVEPTRVLRHPEFAQWCGTVRTADWHRRFRAAAVVYGHLHIPRTTWHDGVRFEEVSLGYPRERRRRAGPASCAARRSCRRRSHA